MRRLFIVGAKIIGLICLFWAITTTLQIISYIGMSFGGTPDNSLWYISILFYAMGATAYVILSLWFSIVLLFRTEWLATKIKLEKDSDLPHRPELNTLLNLGIILVGLYILASAIPGLGKSASTFIGMLFRISGVNVSLPYIIFLYLIPFLMDVFKVAIGLIFVLMPARLISFTEKWQNKINHKLKQT